MINQKENIYNLRESKTENNKNKIYCKDHPDEELSYFCFDC